MECSFEMGGSIPLVYNVIVQDMDSKLIVKSVFGTHQELVHKLDLKPSDMERVKESYNLSKPVAIGNQFYLMSCTGLTR